MTDPSPHEKALEAAKSEVAKLKTWFGPDAAELNAEEVDKTTRAAVEAYLTARVPDDVGEVVKELRDAAESCRTDSAFAASNKAHKWGAELIERAALIRRAAALLTRQSERIRGLEAEVDRLKNMLGNGLVSIPVLSTRTEE